MTEKAPAAAQSGHREGVAKSGDCALALTPLALGLILAFTAVPVGLRQPSLSDIRFRPDPADIALNLVLYLPLGFSLAKLPLGRTILTGLLLSLVIEISQFASATRFPGLADVAANTLGCAIGYVAGKVIAALGGNPSRILLNTPVAGVSAAIIVAMWMAPLVRVSPRTDFSNWNPRYQITLADEPSMDRAWSGDILRTVILPYAMAAEDVSRAYSGGVDGRLPDAILDHGAVLADQLPGIRGNAAFSRQATEAAFETLTRKGALTILVWFMTDDLEQQGPARLVSYSLNPYNGNFMLGQEGRALVFRVRTPASGPIGRYPQVRTGRVVKSGKQVFVAATYDGATSQVYVNGKPEGQAVLSGERLLILMEEVHLPGVGWVLGVLSLSFSVGLAQWGKGGSDPQRVRIGLWLAPVAAFIAAQVFWLSIRGDGPPILNPLVGAAVAVGLLTAALSQRRSPGLRPSERGRRKIP